MGYKYSISNKEKSAKRPTLDGEAKSVALKEAGEFQKKAKQCMQKSLFSSPDPLSASTYYKRAADNYQKCGEYRQERFTRMNSAGCQLQLGAYATAAAEYTRAADLVEQATDESIEIKRELGRKLYLDAADAWQNSNERAKSAASKIQAALALIWGDDSLALPGVALQAIEEAVESNVPDPLNPYSRYRQSGISIYINPKSGETAENPSSEALELAKQQIVTRAYAHESVQQVVYLLVSFGEYASALYASGAVTKLLSENGAATLSLSRAFLAETILTLAMGDPIAAEENFLQRHVQKSSYLNSRECKLAEELFRAVKTRDTETLEEVRSKRGSNKAAISNLHECLRELVGMIRISGIARKGAPEILEKKVSSKKKKTSPESKPSNVEPAPSLEDLATRKTGYEKEVEEAHIIDQDALQDELDALNFGDDDSSVDDDSLDLR
jgi:hypothetical protein